MEKVRIGIIGSGGVAGAHVNRYKAIPQVEIVAVADVIPGKAQQFIAAKELHGAIAFDSHEELLKLDLDGVSVCTPNVAHYQPTVDALRAGKHVLVEKPMCASLEHAVDMVRTARQTNRMLTVGFQPRYDPNMKAIKSIVESGQLGQVYYVQTGAGRRRGMPGGSFISKELAGAGALYDIGCYSLDMAMNSIGYPKPISVSAVATNHLGTNPNYHKEAHRFEVDDFSVALIRLEGGITLNFKIAWAMHMDTLGPTLFLGTEGGLRTNPAGNCWDGSVGNISVFHDVLGNQVESVVGIKQHKLDLFHEKIRDFVEAIHENRTAPIPADEILINQAILEGILQSSELGREVEIHLPEL